MMAINNNAINKRKYRGFFKVFQGRTRVIKEVFITDYRVNILKRSWPWSVLPHSTFKKQFRDSFTEAAPPMIATVESTGVFMYIYKYAEPFLSKTFLSLSIGISEGTLKLRKHRAFQKLQKHNLGS